MHKLILKADGIECLHLKDCIINDFDLIGKQTLKHLKIDGASILDLDIGDTTYNLHIIDVSSLATNWPKFYQSIAKS